MEDTNFVITNIRILIRLNFLKFLRENIALLTLQRVALLVLSQCLERKSEFVEKLVTPMNEELPMVTINNFETISNVKGYYVYKGIWVPKIGETLSTEREPGNPKEKYALCVNKNECIVGHLPQGKIGNFAKTIFYILRADKIQHM